MEESMLVGNQICRGAIEAPPCLVLWSDLRGDALAERLDNVVFIGCVFEPTSLADLRAAGVTVLVSAETSSEVARILELPRLRDPFLHYSTLQEIVQGMVDPGQAAAPLAQLCLHQPWPLAENAWLTLKGFCAESFQANRQTRFAWQTLLLRLSQLDSLRSPLREEVERALCFAQAASFWGRIWNVPWCNEAPSWILEATRTLLWRDEEVMAFPVERWLGHGLAVPLKAMPALEGCLAQRNLCHLLDRSARGARPEWSVDLEDFCWSALESGDQERVDWALRWVERFRPSGLLDRLLNLPTSLPLASRQQAAWLAYLCHLEFEARHRILASGLLGTRQRECLALSSEPEADWVGYVDSEQASWLVDPGEIAAALTVQTDQMGWALGWMSFFPFSELRPLLGHLSPAAIREHGVALECVLDLYRRRAGEL